MSDVRNAARRLRFLEGWSTPLLLSGLLGVMAIWVLIGSESLQRTFMLLLVNIVLVVGLYVFIGNSGVLSFGHMSFAAIGAYTSALLTIPRITKGVLLPDLPEWLAAIELPMILSVLIAGGLAGLFALVVSPILMRLSGIAAGIGTFGLLAIVQVVISNWDSVTAGTRTMIGVPKDLSVTDALLWAFVALLVAYVFQVSSSGRRLRASREDEIAAQAIGVSIVNNRSVAFVVSAFLSGIGGALYAHLLGSFGPTAFFLQFTFINLVMLIVGGMTSLSGAVLGTVVISAVSEGLLELERGLSIGIFNISVPGGLQGIVLAAIMIGILSFRPRGITGGRELTLPIARLAERISDHDAGHGPWTKGKATGGKEPDSRRADS